MHQPSPDLHTVIPANAGIQFSLHGIEELQRIAGIRDEKLDPCVRRDDELF